VLGPSRLEVEISIANLEKYKSAGSDQIPAEMIQAGGETLVSAIHKLETKSIIVRIHKNGDRTDCNNFRGYHR
jgi:hypothetical protein